MPADPRALELVEVAGGLDRAEQEVVPHVLDGDGHLELGRQREHGADLLL